MAKYSWAHSAPPLSRPPLHGPVGLWSQQALLPSQLPACHLAGPCLASPHSSFPLLRLPPLPQALGAEPQQGQPSKPVGLGGLGFCSLGSGAGGTVGRQQEGLVPGQSFQDRRRLGVRVQSLG